MRLSHVRAIAMVCTVVCFRPLAAQDFSFKERQGRRDNSIVVWSDNQSTAMSLRPDEALEGENRPSKCGPFAIDTKKALSILSEKNIGEVLRSPVKCAKLVSHIKKAKVSGLLETGEEVLILGVFDELVGEPQWRGVSTPKITINDSKIKVVFPCDLYYYRGPEVGDATLLLGVLVKDLKPGKYSVELECKPEGKMVELLQKHSPERVKERALSPISGQFSVNDPE